jgi:hypothetical protein
VFLEVQWNPQTIAHLSKFLTTPWEHISSTPSASAPVAPVPSQPAASRPGVPVGDRPVSLSPSQTVAGASLREGLSDLPLDGTYTSPVVCSSELLITVRDHFMFVLNKNEDRPGATSPTSISTSTSTSAVQKESAGGVRAKKLLTMSARGFALRCAVIDAVRDHSSPDTDKKDTSISTKGSGREEKHTQRSHASHATRDRAVLWEGAIGTVEGFTSPVDMSRSTEQADTQTQEQGASSDSKIESVFERLLFPLATKKRAGTSSHVDIPALGTAVGLMERLHAPVASFCFVDPNVLSASEERTWAAQHSASQQSHHSPVAVAVPLSLPPFLPATFSLHVNNTCLVFFQQTILEIADYILEGMIEVLSSSPSTHSPFSSIDDGAFLNLDIVIRNSKLVVPAEPLCVKDRKQMLLVDNRHEWLCVNIPMLSVTNKELRNVKPIKDVIITRPLRIAHVSQSSSASSFSSSSAAESVTVRELRKDRILVSAKDLTLELASAGVHSYSLFSPERHHAGSETEKGLVRQAIATGVSLSLSVERVLGNDLLTQAVHPQFVIHGQCMCA